MAEQPPPVESMAFQLILAKLESQEKGLQALLPLLEKILARLEAQAQQPEVPVATWEQLYTELQQAPEDPAPIEVTPASAPVAPGSGPSADVTLLPRPRGFWRWFLREEQP